MEKIETNNGTELSRDFFVVTYLPREELEGVIRSMSVSHWAYITHDKDNKETHTHVLLRLNNKTTANSIKKKFVKAGKGLDDGKDVNSMVEYVKDMENAFDYLTHANSPEKHQYDINEIVTDDMGYWRGSYSSAGQQVTAERSIENTAYQIIGDIENGVDMRTMARRYGREYIINRRAYHTFVDEMRFEEEAKRVRAEARIKLTMKDTIPTVVDFGDRVQQMIDFENNLRSN